MVMGSTSAMPPMEPTSCMACKNSFASSSGQDGWFFIPVLMGWRLSSTFLKSLRFHSSQCAVFFSHSAYVETSESWLSIHGSQMHSCVAGLPVALLASSLLVAAPALSRSHPIEVSMAVRSPEQGRVVLDLGRRQISVQTPGSDPWPMAGSDW